MTAQEFKKAVKLINKRDIDHLRSMLQETPKLVQYKNQNEETLLHYAARLDGMKLDAVCLLVEEFQASVSVMNKFGNIVIPSEASHSLIITLALY